MPVKKTHKPKDVIAVLSFNELYMLTPAKWENYLLDFLVDHGDVYLEDYASNSFEIRHNVSRLSAEDAMELYTDLKAEQTRKMVERLRRKVAEAAPKEEPEVSLTIQEEIEELLTAVDVPESTELFVGHTKD